MNRMFSGRLFHRSRRVFSSATDNTQRTKRRPISVSRFFTNEHSKKWRLLDFTLLAGGMYTLVEYGEETHLPAFIGGPMRSARAAFCFTAMAVDYKLTYWRYPALSKSVSRELLNATDRSLGGSGLAPAVRVETDEEGGMDIEQIRRELHMRNAERLLQLLQRNRGLYIKVGQAISAMNHVLPQEYTMTLKVLQDHAPLTDFPVVRATLERELGAPLEQLFREFNQEPIASASLAQVHYAITNDGRRCAVKVQHPKLLDQFPGDMFVHRWTLFFADCLFPNFAMSWSHSEIRDNLFKELDFKNEGANGKRTAENFRNNPNIHIPAVYDDLTSVRVLTMEYIDGVRITDVDAIKNMGIDVKFVLKETIRAVAEQIFLFGFVHCDPHPGNLMVRKNPNNEKKGQVVLLDHGLCRELTESTRINFCRLWEGLVLQDDERVISSSLALGVSQWEMFATMLLFRPYRGVVGLGARATRKDRRAIAEKFHSMQEQIFEMMQAMPRELLFVMRNQTYIRYLDKELGSAVNRYVTMARVAVQGLSHTPSPALPPGRQLENRTAHRDLQTSTLGAFRRRLWFEVCLVGFGFYYWSLATATALLKRFGSQEQAQMANKFDDMMTEAPPKI